MSTPCNPAGGTGPTLAELRDRAIEKYNGRHPGPAMIDPPKRTLWNGPGPEDWASGSEIRLLRPVPPERWPYGRPEEHQDCCLLYEGGLYCDCSASDQGEEEEC